MKPERSRGDWLLRATPVLGSVQPTMTPLPPLVTIAIAWFDEVAFLDTSVNRASLTADTAKPEELDTAIAASPQAFEGADQAGKPLAEID